MARWEHYNKQVNPNVAMHLVAEVPPIVRCICVEEMDSFNIVFLTAVMNASSVVMVVVVLLVIRRFIST